MKQTQTSKAGESPSVEVASPGRGIAGSRCASAGAHACPNSRGTAGDPKVCKHSHLLRRRARPGDADQIGEDEKAEANRDDPSRVDDLIGRIKQAHSAQHSTRKLDVTEHASSNGWRPRYGKPIWSSSDVLGENWSAERLRIMTSIAPRMKLETFSRAPTATRRR